MSGFQRSFILSQKRWFNVWSHRKTLSFFPKERESCESFLSPKKSFSFFSSSSLKTKENFPFLSPSPFEKESVSLFSSSSFAKANSFGELKLQAPFVRAIDDLGYKEATEVQKKVIPPALRGLNVVASSYGGSGKTDAYGLPLMQRVQLLLDEERRTGFQRHRAPFGMVIVPSTALVKQVVRHFQKLGVHLKHKPKISSLDGNTSAETQSQQIGEGVDIVVGTPERLLRLSLSTIDETTSQITPPKCETPSSESLEQAQKEPSSHPLNLSLVKCVVLDECDDLFGLNHLPAVMALRRLLPRPVKSRSRISLGGGEREERGERGERGEREEREEREERGERGEGAEKWDEESGISSREWFAMKVREQKKFREVGATQVLQLTATLTQEVDNVSRRWAPKHERFDLNASFSLPPTVKHTAYEVSNRRKESLLYYLLHRRGSLKGQQVLIFTRTTQRARRLNEELSEEGFVSAIARGGVNSKAIQDFRSGKIQILVTTDALARGFDMPQLKNMINYDIPSEATDFIHRVGRVGRGGASGHAFSFVARSSQVIQIGGRTVELNEKHFYGNLTKFCNAKLPITKIPGPWSDPLNEDEQNTHLESLSQNKAKELQQKRREMIEKPELQKKLSRNEKRKIRLHFDKPKEETKKSSPPSLRSFKEGRYEHTISLFQQRKLLQMKTMGVSTPMGKKKKKKRKRNMEDD